MLARSSKFIIFLLAVVAAPLAHAAETVANAELACGNPARAVPLYRAYHPGGDHFYTANKTEHENAYKNLGYANEGVAGYLFSGTQQHAVPLYRTFSGSQFDHFYTTNAAERDNAVTRLGYTDEGITGYIYPDTECGGLPLYRMYNGRIRDHFYTMNLAERDNAVNYGWAQEGVTGYMFPI